MGAGPNEIEMRMFFVLTIAFVLGGIVFGGFVNEFFGESITSWGNEMTGGDATSSGAISAMTGMMSMFIPGLAFIWLPWWFASFLLVLQIIWYYLGFAVILRPLIPMT